VPLPAATSGRRIQAEEGAGQPNKPSLAEYAVFLQALRVDAPAAREDAGRLGKSVDALAIRRSDASLGVTPSSRASTDRPTPADQMSESASGRHLLAIILDA
jgi:hypothetical protein